MTIQRMISRWLSMLLIAIAPLHAQDDFSHPELNWHTIETEHFYIHYHDGAERTARVVAKVAEEIYEPVTSLYNYRPDAKVSFTIKDYDDYSNGAAYFYDNIVEIWASSLDFELRGTHNWLRNVVTHEFTHIVQIQSSMKFGRRLPAFYLQWLGYEAERRPDVLYGYPNVIVSYPLSGFVVPSWFAEGVAQSNRQELGYDSWDTHRDMILRMSALDGKMLTWNEMAVFGKTSLGNESAYNAGFALVRYIADRYGEDKIAEIARNLSSLVEFTVDGAIKRAVGKDGKQVYDEWASSVRAMYERQSAVVKEHLLAGELIADIGFGNFYPTFSPDGKSLAYISNKDADYFSLSSIYIYTLETKNEKKLMSGVRSNLSWSPRGDRIYYAKTTRRNKHWSSFHDIYVYDIEKEEETRITNGLRANAPAVSPDGKRLACVSGSDGTLNVFIMNIDGTNLRRITSYTHGEQVYNPKWSLDGTQIVFAYSLKDGRDIAVIPASGGEVRFLIRGNGDSRDAVFSRDGAKVLYASDRTGIFNIYEYDLETGKTRQLTNVLGGAFMPTMSAGGKLVFASYTSTGYKIAMLNDHQPLPMDTVRGSTDYVRENHDSPQPVMHASLAAHESDAPQLDWGKLRSYDDTQLPVDTSRAYGSMFTSLSFFPFLRVDNYNAKNRGVDIIKPGLYVLSRDVLDKYGIFAGAALNRNLERDLFFIFGYRDRIPGLFELGLEPTISLELYNITRKTEAKATFGIDTLGLNITYSLLEFDAVLRQKVFTEVLDLELRFSHSRYTASYELPPRPGIPQIIRFDDLYFIGNDVSATWTLRDIAPSRTQEINPFGRQIKFRYDYEFSKFNPTGDIEIQNGVAVPLYQRINFHRLEVDWREHLPLPGWKHTLTARFRGGSILGPPVDDFFDFYAGGLTGMKGYPFYALGGNEVASFNLTYRFPLWENIDLRVLHLYFDKVYAAVYGDVGNAWNGYPGGDKFKRDVGFELRIETFSWYSFPTRIFFDASYGFDRFERFIRFDNSTVTYGKEWRFYFGILFGFELD